MDNARPYIVLAMVLISCTGLFQWLYKQVTREKISFYDAIFFAGLPALIRFVEKRTTGLTNFIPAPGDRILWFSIYVLVFYWALRGWHGARPKQAWLIIACWVPMITVCMTVWYFANKEPAPVQ